MGHSRLAVPKQQDQVSGLDGTACTKWMRHDTPPLPTTRHLTRNMVPTQPFTDYASHSPSQQEVRGPHLVLVIQTDSLLTLQREMTETEAITPTCHTSTQPDESCRTQLLSEPTATHVAKGVLSASVDQAVCHKGSHPRTPKGDKPDTKPLTRRSTPQCQPQTTRRSIRQKEVKTISGGFKIQGANNRCISASTLTHLFASALPDILTNEGRRTVRAESQVGIPSTPPNGFKGLVQILWHFSILHGIASFKAEGRSSLATSQAPQSEINKEEEDVQRNPEHGTRARAESLEVRGKPIQPRASPVDLKLHALKRDWSLNRLA